VYAVAFGCHAGFGRTAGRAQRGVSRYNIYSSVGKSHGRQWHCLHTGSDFGLADLHVPLQEFAHWTDELPS